MTACHTSGSNFGKRSVMLHKFVQKACNLHTLGSTGGYLQIKLLLEPSHRVKPILIFLEFLMDIIGGVLSAVGHQKASYQRLDFAAAVVQILKLPAVLAVIGNGIDAKTVVFYDFVLVGNQAVEHFNEGLFQAFFFEGRCFAVFSLLKFGLQCQCHAVYLVLECHIFLP